jgi:hypothetical protein
LLEHQKFKARDGREVEFQRPALVSQFAQWINDVLPQRTTLMLTVYGMRTDLKMKVFEWQRERLTLPGELVWQSSFHRDAQEVMENAGSVAYSLRQAIKRTYPRDGKGNKNAFDTLIAEAERQFWAELRPDYDTFLQDLAQLSPEDTVAVTDLRKRWEKQVREVGMAALDDAIDQLDTDAQALRRQVEARRQFAFALYKLFTPAEEQAKRKARNIPKQADSPVQEDQEG